MRVIKIFGEDSLKNKFICGLAVSLFAVVLFVYFCAQNTSVITLNVNVDVSLILFLVAIVSYMMSLTIFRKAFTAFIFCVVCWVGFYLEPLIFDFLIEHWPFERGKIIFLTIIILVVAFVTAIKSQKFRFNLKIIYFFMGILAVIFTINVSILIHTYNSSTQKDLLPIKKDFYVDENTKSPNIYWIHPDGMLGINAVKKYFGEDQREFLDALNRRGFMLNPDANFEAQHATAHAIPILMNPYSYDEWISEAIMKPLHPHDFLYLRKNSELQYALSAKNYALNIIAGSGYYYFINSEGGGVSYGSWAFREKVSFPLMMHKIIFS